MSRRDDASAGRPVGPVPSGAQPLLALLGRTKPPTELRGVFTLVLPRSLPRTYRVPPTLISERFTMPEQAIASDEEPVVPVATNDHGGSTDVAGEHMGI